MDIHPDAAATVSALAQPADASTSANLGSGSSPERRVDDVHLRARLLKMIISAEQSRKATPELPPR